MESRLNLGIFHQMHTKRETFNNIALKSTEYAEVYKPLNGSYVT